MYSLISEGVGLFSVRVLVRFITDPSAFLEAVEINEFLSKA